MSRAIRASLLSALPRETFAFSGCPGSTLHHDSDVFLDGGILETFAPSFGNDHPVRDVRAISSKSTLLVETFPRILEFRLPVRSVSRFLRRAEIGAPVRDVRAFLCISALLFETFAKVAVQIVIPRAIVKNPLLGRRY